MQELIDYIQKFIKIVQNANKIMDYPNSIKDSKDLQQILSTHNIFLEEFIILTIFFKNRKVEKLLSALDVCLSLDIDLSGLNSKVYFLSICSNIETLKGVEWKDIIDLKKIYDKYQKQRQLKSDDVKIFEIKNCEKEEDKDKGKSK